MDGFMEGDSTFSALRSLYIFVLFVSVSSDVAAVDVKSKLDDEKHKQ